MKKLLAGLVGTAVFFSNGCGASAHAAPIHVTQPTQPVIEQTLETHFDYDANNVTSLDEIKSCVFQVDTHDRYKIEGLDKEYTTDGHATVVAFAKQNGQTYVLTNNHVASPMNMSDFLENFSFDLAMDSLLLKKELPDKDKLKFSLAESKGMVKVGTATLPLEVLVTNPKEDIVLGRVNSDKLPLCDAIEDSSKLRVGNTLYISGFGGDEYKASRGIFSGPSSEGFEDSSSYQIGDPQIIPGYSGGGVFALANGKPVLVGINRLQIEGMYTGFIGTSLIDGWLAKTPYAKIWPKLK